jgi:hypothetical protein
MLPPAGTNAKPQSQTTNFVARNVLNAGDLKGWSQSSW